ncbi:YSC84-related protein [Shimia abyssi]|uniref:Las17-binding protein actin regulator n=1 Tax=Shimia abyssi TaxID=1662395 RepID=A0A2P8FAU6_9RHOB|nr:lipid-binding SYLF domain-containing protein [Shimia abyssi]PSL18834.1 Las17-binding protein actin regulator [Shimia abyssi]
MRRISRARVFLGGVGLSMMATMSAAQSAAQDQMVEGWTILRHQETGACVMEKVNEDGYLFRVGKTEVGGRFEYVAVYTKDESVRIYGNVAEDVVIDMDGLRFPSRAVGDFRDDGYRGMYVKTEDPAFSEALARKYVMTVNPDTDEPFAISLDGTFKAMEAVNDCEAASAAAASVGDDGKRGELVAASQAAWGSLLSQNGRAAELATKASAALVFPEVAKFGLGVGGERGNGVLFEGDQVAGFYRTSSVSVGAQAGVQTYGYAIMFMTAEALERFKSKRGYELGVDGSIAVVEAGVTAEIDTTNITTDTVAFVFDEKGLMASAAVEGSRIKPID